MLSCAFWLRLLEVWCSACERLFIVFTPARETALPSCLGSALHTGERREEGKEEEEEGGVSIDTTQK